MGIEISLLAIASAGLHPFREFIVKSTKNPEFTFFLVILFTAVIALVHLLISGQSLTNPRVDWSVLMLSAAGELVYGIFVVNSLKHGDISIYYPIIRSSPLGIAVVDIFLLGTAYSAALIAGIGITLVGVFLVQYQPGKRLLENPRALSTAFVAMAGICLYSLADAHLMQSVSPEFRLFWTYTLILPLLGIVAFRTARTGTENTRLLDRGAARLVLRCFLGACCAYGSLYLILVALKLGGNVAAVSAVRQLSLPFSVILGGMVLGEQAVFRRLASSLVLVAGIAVIIFAR